MVKLQNREREMADANGVELRDWFAGQALAGILANSTWPTQGSGEPLHFRRTTMARHENLGFLPRMLSALGGALKRGILGKSDDAYMKQFNGSDAYWDRAIAAQLGWPRIDAGNHEVKG